MWTKQIISDTVYDSYCYIAKNLLKQIAQINSYKYHHPLQREGEQSSASTSELQKAKIWVFSTQHYAC